MKLRSRSSQSRSLRARTVRSLLGRLVIAGTAAGALAALPGGTAARAAVTGDASTLVNVMDTGWPAINPFWSYNSTGAGFGGGSVAVGRVYVDILGNDGPIGTPHLTMWHRDTDGNDPICSIVGTAVVAANTRVTVQCFDAAGVAANTGQFFLTYTNRARPDRAGVSGPSLVRLVTDSATAKSQYPATQYRSSGTGSIIVYRQNPGIYQARIPGGALTAPQGVAFTSAVGGTARWCNPQAWYPVGADMYVDVRCFAPGGALADSRFSLTLTRTNVFGNPGMPGGSQYAPWTSTSSTTTGWYGWNSTGGSNTVRPGSWVGDPAAETYVEFAGVTGPGKVSMVVSGYGPNRCNVHRDIAGPTYHALAVRCIDGAGTVVSQASVTSKLLAA